MCWPVNTHRRALEQAELVLARAACRRRSPSREKVIAPIERAEEQLEPVAGRESARPCAAMPNAYGSATAATAMNTAARPIMLCMNATSSGIFVISTRCARDRRR